MLLSVVVCCLATVIVSSANTAALPTLTKDGQLASELNPVKNEISPDNLPQKAQDPSLPRIKRFFYGGGGFGIGIGGGYGHGHGYGHDHGYGYGHDHGYGNGGYGGYGGGYGGSYSQSSSQSSSGSFGYGK